MFHPEKYPIKRIITQHGIQYIRLYAYYNNDTLLYDADAFSRVANPLELNIKPEELYTTIDNLDTDVCFDLYRNNTSGCYATYNTFAEAAAYLRGFYDSRTNYECSPESFEMNYDNGSISFRYTLDKNIGRCTAMEDVLKYNSMHNMGVKEPERINTYLGYSAKAEMEMYNKIAIRTNTKESKG